jgi:nicotinamide riboside kinase
VKRITVDSRAILRRLGHMDMDRMTQTETAAFQREYFERKLALEHAEDAFLTERSFVDVAAYWVERDSPGDTDGPFVAACHQAVARYDLHIYCPWGVIPFAGDGYRSADLTLHERFDARVRSFLVQWALPAVALVTADLGSRVAQVEDALRRIKSA